MKVSSAHKQAEFSSEYSFSNQKFITTIVPYLTVGKKQLIRMSCMPIGCYLLRGIEIYYVVLNVSVYFHSFLKKAKTKDKVYCHSNFPLLSAIEYVNSPSRDNNLENFRYFIT